VLADRNNRFDNKVKLGRATPMEISDSTAIMTMDPEMINHAVNHTEDEENSVYSSGMVPDMMWKIREDCDKLMANYNESSEGKFSYEKGTPRLFVFFSAFSIQRV
jgi:hypothetical protein